jgi:type II secretory pathway pseudopilin PulG
MAMKTSARPASAFTVVELLVVLAVLALVVGLLMPTMGRTHYLAPK